MRAYPSSRSPPTAPPACAAPEPTRRPTRSGSSATPPASPTWTPPDPDRFDAAWLLDGPVHLNCQFAEPLVPEPDSPRRSAPTSIGASSRRTSRTIPWSRSRRRRPRAAGARARGRSWSPATTRGRRRVGSPSRRTGRCSPSRAAGRGPARTRSAPTGCCSAPTWADRIERVVVFGHPTLSRPVLPAARARGRRGRLRAGHGPVARPGRVPVDSEHDAVTAGPDDPGWLEEWRAADRSLGTRTRRVRRRAARPHAVRRGSGRQRRRPARRPALRRGQQPDPRPRPDGDRPPRRRAPDGARPTGAWPASTARSRPRSGRRWAGRGPPARSRYSAT